MFPFLGLRNEYDNTFPHLCKIVPVHLHKQLYFLSLYKNLQTACFGRRLVHQATQVMRSVVRFVRIRFYDRLLGHGIETNGICLIICPFGCRIIARHGFVSFVWNGDREPVFVGSLVIGTLVIPFRRKQFGNGPLMDKNLHSSIVGTCHPLVQSPCVWNAESCTSSNARESLNLHESCMTVNHA